MQSTSTILQTHTTPVSSQPVASDSVCSLLSECIKNIFNKILSWLCCCCYRSDATMSTSTAASTAAPAITTIPQPTAPSTAPNVLERRVADFPSGGVGFINQSPELGRWLTEGHRINMSSQLSIQLSSGELLPEITTSRTGLHRTGYMSYYDQLFGEVDHRTRTIDSNTPIQEVTLSLTYWRENAPHERIRTISTRQRPNAASATSTPSTTAALTTPSIQERSIEGMPASPLEFLDQSPELGRWLTEGHRINISYQVNIQRPGESTSERVCGRTQTGLDRQGYFAFYDDVPTESEERLGTLLSNNAPVQEVTFILTYWRENAPHERIRTICRRRPPNAAATTSLPTATTSIPPARTIAHSQSTITSTTHPSTQERSVVEVPSTPLEFLDQSPELSQWLTEGHRINMSYQVSIQRPGESTSERVCGRTQTGLDRQGFTDFYSNIRWENEERMNTLLNNDPSIQEVTLIITYWRENAPLERIRTTCRRPLNQEHSLSTVPANFDDLRRISGELNQWLNDGPINIKMQYAIQHRRGGALNNESDQTTDINRDAGYCAAMYSNLAVPFNRSLRQGQIVSSHFIITCSREHIPGQIKFNYNGSTA